MQDVVQCYHALDTSVPGCGWPADDPNRWMCDALQGTHSPGLSLAEQRPISSHRWTLKDTPTWHGHEWAVLNYDGSALHPTSVNGQPECTMCLGYAKGGIHPFPPALIAGLWQTSQGMMWNIQTYRGRAQITECGTWDGNYQDEEYDLRHLTSTKAHCRSLPSQDLAIEQRNGLIGFKPLGQDALVYEKDNALMGPFQFAAWRAQTSVEPFALRGEWVLTVSAVEENMESIYPQELLRRILRAQVLNTFRYDFGSGNTGAPLPQISCHDPNPVNCTADAGALATFNLSFGADGWPMLELSLAKPIHIGGQFQGGGVYVMNFFGFLPRAAEVADNGSMLFCDHALVETTAGFAGHDTATFGLGFCLRPSFSVRPAL